MRVTALCLTIVASLRAGGAAMAQSEQIVRVLPRDAIPAIDCPTFEAVAKARTFDANEPMIGLVGTSERRAYSTWQLDRHEIVNDTLEGRPVAVTWCPLCGTAIVYARTVAGRTLTFGVSGMLYRDALVMYDRETGTLCRGERRSPRGHRRDRGRRRADHSHRGRRGPAGAGIRATGAGPRPHVRTRGLARARS